jgi:hypothetical protein
MTSFNLKQPPKSLVSIYSHSGVKGSMSDMCVGWVLGCNSVHSSEDQAAGVDQASCLGAGHCNFGDNVLLSKL